MKIESNNIFVAQMQIPKATTGYRIKVMDIFTCFIVTLNFQLNVTTQFEHFFIEKQNVLITTNDVTQRVKSVEVRG